MRLELEDIAVTIDGIIQASSTTISAADAYVVAVATTLPDRVIQLTSCYLAALSGPAAVSHLLHLRGPERRFTQRILGPLAGTTHPRRCLLDHAGELQNALVEILTGDVQVDVPATALARADGVWGP